MPLALLSNLVTNRLNFEGKSHPSRKAKFILGDLNGFYFRR